MRGPATLKVLVFRCIPTPEYPTTTYNFFPLDMSFILAKTYHTGRGDAFSTIPNISCGMLVSTLHRVSSIPQPSIFGKFPKITQLHTAVTLHLLNGFQSFWHLGCLARAETPENAIYSRIFWVLPAYPVANVKRISGKFPTLATRPMWNPMNGWN